MRKPGLAFFGGSFDPPHIGHLGIARAALAAGATERVLFVPAWSPPHKPGRVQAPFADRLAMVKLLIGGEPDMATSDIEARLALRPSYTIDVMAALEGEFPAWRLQLLIGGDSLGQLHTWYKGAELAQKYEVITYPREGEIISVKELRRNWPADLAEKLLKGVLEGGFFKISSTKLRNDVANVDVPGHINSGTTEPVEEYYRRNQFYWEEGKGET